MVDEIGGLKRAGRDDAVRLAAVAAAAMQNDPLQRYFFPGARRRMRLSRGVFRLFLSYGIEQGNVLVTSAACEGLAYWQTPEDRRVVAVPSLLAGGLKLLARAGVPAVRRMVGASTFGLRVHHRLVPGPHWYLALLAVDPAHQGRGHAGALLRPVLSWLDGQGLPCYLETHRRENLPLYEHFGFLTAEEVRIPRGGPIQWCLLRPPRRPAAAGEG